MSDGWVKLHRKILGNDMYVSLTSEQRDVLITCLLLAGHKGTNWEWQRKVFKCEPGQFITSLASLKKKCARGCSIRNIRTALLKLEKWQFLTNKSTKTGRLITILKWDTYQGVDESPDKGTDKALTKHRQSTDKALTTNKNDKKVKNVKNKNKHIVEQIITYLNEKTGKNFSPHTPQTIQHINARLSKGSKLEDFIYVIDVKSDQWMLTEDEQWLRPNTLFCPKHFEEYRNQKKKTIKSWAERRREEKK